MSYTEFLNSLIMPISSFITWFGVIIDYLLTNYFFITMLGITLISSLLFYFLSNLLFNINNSKNLDDIYHAK